MVIVEPGALLKVPMPRKINILILEHDTYDLELLSRELKKGKLTYSAKVVEDRASYEAAILSFSPDLILSDYSLPLFDGVSALSIRNERCPQVPFIFVSGTIGEENAVELIRSGATDYALKEKLFQLVPKIERALREAQDQIERINAERRLKESLEQLKKAEAELKESHKKIADILESIADGFFVVDFEWKVTYWNRAAEEMTGISKENILGKSLWALFDKNQYPISYAGYEKALRQRVPVQFEDFYVPLDAWTGVSAYPSEEGISVYFKNITQKVLVEKSLRESEEKTRLIMNAALDAIVCMDTSGVVVFWNSRAEKIFGWPAAEAVGRVLSELIVPENFRERHERGFRRYLETGEARLLNTLIEMQAVDKKGRVFPVELSLVHVRDTAVPFFCGFIRDISERKKAERKLLESELSLKKAQALAHVGSWEENFVHRTSIWSDETFRIFGFEPWEIGPSLEAYLGCIHPEDRPEIEKIIRQSEKDLQPRSFSHRIIKKGGEIRYVVSESRFELDKTGKPLGIHGIVQDITAEKLHEIALEQKNLELQASEIKYRQLFEDNPMPMWVYDLTSLKFLDVNDAAIRHYGWSRAEFLSMTLRDIRPPEEIDVLEKDVAQLASSRRYSRGVFRHLKKNGQAIYVQIQARPVRYHTGPARLVLAIDVTEKYQAEEALKQSEKRFKSLVQGGADLIAILDTEAVYQYVSPTIKRILGFSPAQLIGKNAFSFIHPDDNDIITRQFKTLLSKKRVQLAPLRFRNAKGEWHWIETTATNMINDPSIAGIVVNSRDVTNTYRMLEEIKRVKEHYEAVAGATSDAIYENDLLRGRIRITGQGFKKLFGYNIENTEIDTDFMVNGLHPDDKAHVFETFDKAARDPAQKQWSVEYRFLTAQGAYVYVSNRFSVIFQDGVPVKTIGAVQDINARKLAELRLAASERRFRALIENSADGLATIGPDKKVKDISPTGVRILGYGKEWFVGNDRFDFTHPDDLPMVNRVLETIIQNPEQIQKIEARFKHRDGSYVWVESTFHNQLQNPDIGAIVLNYRDITARKKQEAEREQLIKELTLHNQDLKQFSYITSHNLRAPVSNLLGIMDLLDTSKMADGETKHLLELFHKSTLQLDETISDLVSVLIVKQNPGVERKELDIEEKLKKVLRMLGHEVRASGAQIRYNFLKAPKVSFNPAYLESIFLNLLTNAIKYRAPDRALLVDIGSRPEGKYTLLTVKDNGIGMDVKRYGDRLFGLYQRFHPTSEGKGMGLYMIHSQVLSLGGKIEVDGEPGKGVCFKIYFPNNSAAG